MTSVRLRRGVLARLRTIRVYEAVAWLVIGVSANELRDGFNGGQEVEAVVFGTMALGVRLAIATAWVKGDDTGVSWRSLFVTHHVLWDQVASMTIGMKGFLPATLGIGPRVTVPCLFLTDVEGRRRDLGASVWCSMARQAEFIAAAHTISSTDWSLSDDRPPAGPRDRWNQAVAATRRSRSGTRVALPVPRRRQGPNA
jgi:hypothetical protein